MRRRLGLTIEDLGRVSRISHSAISRIERDATRGQPWLLGRLLPLLASQFENAFPGTDVYDFLIPPTSFGRWLKNQRLRHGMKLRELSEALIVNIYSAVRYESDRSKPSPEVRARLRRLFGDAPFK